MNLSHFFIRRPIFAGVLSALIFLAGLIALPGLPISEYPEVVPPTIVVQGDLSRRQSQDHRGDRRLAAGTGRSTASRVRSIMFSQATADGVMTLTVTFKLGTDIDKAQVQVQNRVSQALPKLPEEVRSWASPPPSNRPTSRWSCTCSRRTAATTSSICATTRRLQVKDVLARIPGRGRRGGVRLRRLCDAHLAQPGQDRRAATSPPATSSPPSANKTCRSPAGVIGQQPVASPVDFEMQVNVKGRLRSEEEFGNIIVKTGAERREDAAQGRGAHRTRRRQLRAAFAAQQQDGRGDPDLPDARAPTRSQLSNNVRANDGGAEERISPRAWITTSSMTRRFSCAHSIEAVVHTLLEAILLVVIVVIIFLQTWRAAIIPLAAVPVSLVGTFAVMLAVRLLASTRCRCSAWCWPSASWWTTPSWWWKTSSATSRAGCRPSRRRTQAMNEVTGPDRGHGAGAVRGVRAHGVHQRPDRPVLQAVRADDRDLAPSFPRSIR